MAAAQSRLTGLLLLGLCALAAIVAGALYGPAASIWAVAMICLWTCAVVLAPMTLLFVIIGSGLVPVWKGLPPNVRSGLSGASGYAVAMSVAVLMALLVIPALIRRRQLAHGYAVEQAPTNIEHMVKAGASTGPRWFYSWLSGRSIRRRGNTDMLLMPLGPSAHWAMYVLAGCVSTAVAIGMAFLIDLGSASRAQAGVGIVTQLACAAVLFLVAMQIQGMLSSIFARRGEQALLRLAPAAPARDDLNRRLGRALLARVALVWAVMVGLSLLFGLVTGALPEAMLRGLGLASISLLLLPTVLRDYGKLQDAKDYLVGTLLVLGLGCAIAIAAFVPRLALVLAPLSVASSLLLCWLRLDAASTAAPMFPAGGARA
jgi:hypothetical protein